MPQKRKRTQKSIDAGMISRILGQLDSLQELFDDENFEDLEYRLDELSTSIIKAGLVAKQKARGLKFHAIIEVLDLDVDGRDELAAAMETFEDLINTYGDKPSEEEIEEAQDILEKVVSALKRAFEQHGNQLRLI